MDEPLGDGALGEPDDREGRLGARARVGGRLGGELDQLADAQLAVGRVERGAVRRPARRFRAIHE